MLLMYINVIHVNVGKTVIAIPHVITILIGAIYNYSQSWVVYDIGLPTLYATKMLSIKPNIPYIYIYMIYIYIYIYDIYIYDIYV